MIHWTSAAMIPRMIQVDVDIELAPVAAVAAILADRRGGVSSPHFSHSMRPALLFRRGRYSVGRRKAYRGIRLSRPTLEMPAERQPKGPVEEAGRVRRRPCPMSHIARRAAPALAASSTGARHIEC